MSVNIDGAGLLGSLADSQKGMPNYSDPTVALEALARHNIQQNLGLNLGPFILG